MKTITSNDLGLIKNMSFSDLHLEVLMLSLHLDKLLSCYESSLNKDLEFEKTYIKTLKLIAERLSDTVRGI